MKRKTIYAAVLLMLALTLGCLVLPLGSLAEDAAGDSGNGDAADPPALTGEVWDGQVATGYESGTGTAADPYVIRTPGQLALLATSVNNALDSGEGKYYVLAGNLDLDGRQWTPIGTKENPFAGSFNGKGYTVFGFEIKTTDAETQILAGVFGAVANGSIKNLNVDDAVIDVVGKASVAGGIAGTAQNSAVIACTVGGNSSIRVTDTGVGNSTYAGGIVGSTSNSTNEQSVEIRYCINRAPVYAGNTVSSVGAGGIVGLAGAQTAVYGCLNYGAVESGTLGTISTIAGGIVGNMGASGKPASVEACANYGLIRSPHTAGGIVGRLNVAGNEIRDSYSTASVWGNLDYAGLGVGRCETNGTLSGCGYYASVEDDVPDGYGTWFASNGIGAKNPGLVDTISPGTLNEMDKATMQPLLAALEAEIEEGIAASVAEETPDPGDDETTGDEDQTTDTPTSDETDTQAPATDETTAPGTTAGSTTAGDSGDNAETQGSGNSGSGGCGSVIPGVGVILVGAVAALAVVARRKKND